MDEEVDVADEVRERSGREGKVEPGRGVGACDKLLAVRDGVLPEVLVEGGTISWKPRVPELNDEADLDSALPFIPSIFCKPNP